MSPTSYQTAPPRGVRTPYLAAIGPLTSCPGGAAGNTVDIEIPMVSDGPVTSTRLTRSQQVERNRDRVLGAARKVFSESGYAKASLDAIAERAGFSKGVVYSQFDSKADLFLTLLERRIEDRAA